MGWGGRGLGGPWARGGAMGWWGRGLGGAMGWGMAYNMLFL